MLPENTDKFISYFDNITDHRIERHKLYPIIEIVFLVVSGNICGARSWRDYVNFGKAKLYLLKQYLPFSNGIPSKNTLYRVYSAIKPELLQSCFTSWVKSIYVCVNDVIPIDGKCIRGSHNRKNDKAANHIVSAYSSTHSLVLGQIKVEEKSNEITAIPQLLDAIDVEGSTITIDAMGTQKAIAKKIIEKKADYILALKDNHKCLNENVKLFLENEFNKAGNGCLKSNLQVDKGHGRLEERTCYVSDNISWLEKKDAWAGLQSLIMIKSKRTIGDQESTESRFYLSSKPADPLYLNHAIRSHWSIENQLHWILDVTMGEDGSRVRKDYAPQNMSLMKHIALNLLQNAKKEMKGISINGLKKLAGWCDKTLGIIMSKNF
jgi:predicted transposase YbfD/YdcC